MGLLDKFAGLGQLDETQTQGLLAAASQMLQQSGPSRTPQGFGQIVGGGMEAYQGATMAAKRRKAEEDRAAMESKMYGMKMQGMESDLAAEAQKRDYEQRRDAHMSQFGGAAAPGGQPQQAPQLNSAPQASLPGMPQPMASPAAPAADTFQQKMARAAHYRAGGFHRDADAAEVEALKFREEYSLDLKNLQGADGKLRPYQVSKFGGVRDTGLGVAPDMVEVGLGNRKQFVDKNAVRNGQSYAMGQTPDSVASTASAAANRAQQDRHHDDRENRERAAPRGQIIQTDQGPMLADPRTGTARPMTGADGSTLGPKSRPIPTQIQKAYVENNGSLRKVQAALDAVKAYPDGLGAWNYLGDTVRQRTDLKGVNVRALVADIGSQKIHDRSGAAVTASETPRLKPFIPAATDDPATVEKKLEMFKTEYRAMQSEMEDLYSTDMGYKPLGKSERGGSSAPSPAVRKYNPKTEKIE